MKSKQNVEANSSVSGALASPTAKAQAKQHARHKSGDGPAAHRSLDPQLRQEHIKTAAYFRALHRGFAPNQELEDWFAAEVEVDASGD